MEVRYAYTINKLEIEGTNGEFKDGPLVDVTKRDD